MRKYKIFFAVITVVIISLPGFGQGGNVKQVKLTKFRLQSSHLINQSGEVLSSGSYKPDVWWFPVNVPSTVLSGLVANKIYPDPYHGLNNMLIPDASDEFNKKYDLEKYSQLPGSAQSLEKALLVPY
jgi:hypothetical protein